MREVQIKVPHKYRKIVTKLRKREDIAVVKADKERGVVVMNRDKHYEKYLELLDTKQFQKLNHDPKKGEEGTKGFL